MTVLQRFLSLLEPVTTKIRLGQKLTLAGLVVGFIYRKKLLDAYHLVTLGNQKKTVSESRPIELLDLPPEIREQIWNKLPNSDLKRLRQVCRRTQLDVDYLVGVDANLKDDPACIDWVQTVTVRSLSVERVVGPIGSDFLAKPTLLRTLFILPEHLSSRNLGNLLAETSRLRVLTIQSFWDVEGTPDIDMPQGSMSFLALRNKEYSQVILNGLRRKVHLKQFLLTMPPFTVPFTSTTPESLPYKDLEFPRQRKASGFQEFPHRLETLGVVAPFIPTEDLAEWKAVFDAQTVLETLVCFLGKVHWTLYANMIQTSAPTLRCIVLQDVQSFRPGEELFDWAILAGCQNLECLHFFAALEAHDQDPKYLESVNFGRLELGKLKDLRLMFVLLAKADLARLLLTAPRLKKLDLQFFRREADYFPILVFLGGILSRHVGFHTLYIADLQEVMFHEEEIREDAVHDLYGTLQYYASELNRYRNVINTFNFVALSVQRRSPVVAAMAETVIKMQTM